MTLKAPRFFAILLLAFFVSNCSARAATPTAPGPAAAITQTSPPTQASQIVSPASATVTVTVTAPAPFTPIPAPTDAPVTPDATLPAGVRLPPERWREWPVVPVLSARAVEILKAAQSNPALDMQTFSKVGDCQFTTETFLAGYVSGLYTVPAGLEATAQYFHDSMASNSITAANGLGISSVLNPLFGAGAGHKECNSAEAPLDCELRLRRPALVLVAMGTNWKPNGEVSFEKYLRQVVDKILATGALPILASKADNIETDWKLDQAIAHVAYDYDLPLVNVWRATRPLNNHGLEAPLNEYLTGDGWMARNLAWLKTLDVVRTQLQP